MSVHQSWIILMLTQFSVNPCFSQDKDPLPDPVPYWITAMSQDVANFNEALLSFNDYWKDKVFPHEAFEDEDEHFSTSSDVGADEEPGAEMAFQYRRFMKWSLLQRSSIHADGTTRSPEEWRKANQQNTHQRNVLISADWQSAGPNSTRMNPPAYESRIGRMCQLKFHPTHPERLYAISGSGGLFISIDNGIFWRSSGTDQLPFGFQPASVCIDYTNDQILYLGMGDANYASQGHGVFKSIDGGQTWFDASGPMGDRIVYEIMMSPTNHQSLIAATDNGIWKTIDGGLSWERKLSLQADALYDMKFKPNSVDTLYGCTNSKFFRSIDAGENWTSISNGILVPTGGGRGMRIAISAADPNIVYLGMLAKEGTVFKSSDAGKTFQQVYQDTLMQSLVTYSGLVGSGSNGNYNFSMVADPENADVVYFGTQTLWKSIDGGTSWTSLYAYLSRVHPDIHDLKFSPLDHSLFNLNDGGLVIDPDGSNQWYQRNDGIAAGEIYNGGQSPIRRDMLLIGTQDNGSLVYHHNQWNIVGGGDVYDRFWFDYHTPDKYYSDRGNSAQLESPHQYNLHFPLTTLGNRKYEFTPADTSVAFLCQNETWRCKNINDAVPTWTQITQPLSSSSSDFIRDMAVSASDANELYVVYGNSRMLHSQNALDAEPIFDTLITPASSLYGQACIALSRQDANLIYFAAWNQIFKSNDKGEHWTEISENLPGDNITKIIHDDYNDDESIYVLCGNRVYYRNDSLMSWVDYAQGLPGLAYVSDLLVYNDGSRKSLIRAITYGRGVFETPMYKPKPLPSVDFSVDTQVVCTRSAVQYTDLSKDGVSWHWEFEGGDPATFDGRVPPPVIYNVPGFFTASLTVTNPYGEVKMTKKEYIEVKFQFTIPVAEGFEADFPPPHIELAALGASHVNWRQVPLGGYGESAQGAIFYDSYTESKADMRLNVNLSQCFSATLIFDLAYARLLGNVKFDSLEILASTDCGLTLKTIYKRGGQQLATMPDIETALSFDPGHDDWRTDSVDLSSYCGSENVFLYFRGFGSAGEIMIVDNINIQGTLTGTKDFSNAQPDFVIVPNPNSGIFTLIRKSMDRYQITITNVEGKIVWQQMNVGGSAAVKISLAQQLKGAYWVTVKTGEYSASKMVLVQ